MHTNDIDLPERPFFKILSLLTGSVCIILYVWFAKLI